MERELMQTLEELERTPGVTGLLCTDDHGLCLGAKGDILKQYSGTICSLAENAGHLRSDQTKAPIITMESEGGQILMIKKQNDISMAVMKTAPQSWH